MNRNPQSSLYPFGTPQQRVAVVGAIGIDAIADESKPFHLIEEGGKHPVTSYDELQKLIKEYEIVYGDDQIYPGVSPANFAVGVSKLADPDAVEHEVVMFTIMASSDPSSKKITAEMNKHDVSLVVTPYREKNGDTARNAFSVILITKKDRKIISFKPVNTPPINVKTLRPQPGVLVMGSVGGKWEETVANTLAFVDKTNVPLVLLASESLMKQANKDTAKCKAMEAFIKKATGFLGNDLEGYLLLKDLGMNPPKNDLHKLALLLKKASEGSLQIISLSSGKNGAVLLDAENNFHTLQVPDFPIRNIGYPVNMLGAGDAYNAVLFEGIRTFGASIEGIKRSMLKAGEGATMSLTKPDAQTGQMVRKQFLAKPHPDFRHNL